LAPDRQILVYFILETAKHAREIGVIFCKFIDAFGQTRWIGPCIFRTARMMARSTIPLSLSPRHPTRADGFRGWFSPMVFIV
jgi:hypothetical protein